MLGRTLPRLAHVHKTSMRFPDRRLPKESHKPHPHPSAPPAIVEKFDQFQKTLQSGPHLHPELVKQADDKINMGAREVAADIHLLPERFWRTPAMLIGELEAEAIMSGGAI